VSKRSRALIELAMAAAVACGVSAPCAAGALPVAGSCTVRFFGTSTLHDFEGTAPCALLAIEPPDASGQYAARAEVAIARIETGNWRRDERMREMFEAEKFPRIVASFAAVDPAALRSQRAGALPFRLALHGVERNVAPEISGYAEEPGKRARFRAAFPLSLRDFKLEAPVVLGFVRVGDAVRVEVDVELFAKGEARPARSTR
jgi:polyisoprenoid-binding protein YceI